MKDTSCLISAWIVGVVLDCVASIAHAEVHVGGPETQNGLAVSSVYLTDITLDPDPSVSPGEDVIHMECDLSATGENQQGFSEGAWVPYITCNYLIEKQGSDWQTVGTMLPMVAKDGPHYANNIRLDGPGTYRVTYTLYPPSQNGFFRHTDSVTGVASWWDPFSVSWTFEYPAPSGETGH